MSRAVDDSDLNAALEDSMKTLKLDDERRRKMQAQASATAAAAYTPRPVASTMTATAAASTAVSHAPHAAHAAAAAKVTTATAVSQTPPAPNAAPIKANTAAASTNLMGAISTPIPAQKVPDASVKQGTGSPAPQMPKVAIPYEKELNEIKQLDLEIQKRQAELKRLSGILEQRNETLKRLETLMHNNKLDVDCAKKIMDIYDPSSAISDMESSKRKLDWAREAFLGALKLGYKDHRDYINETERAKDQAYRDYESQSKIASDAKHKHGLEKRKYESAKSIYDASYNEYWDHRIDKVAALRDTMTGIQNEMIKLNARKAALELDLQKKQAIEKEAKTKEEIRQYKLRVDASQQAHGKIISDREALLPKLKAEMNAILDRARALVSEDFELLAWSRDFLKASDLPMEVPGGPSRASLLQVCQQMRKELDAKVKTLQYDCEQFALKLKQHLDACDVHLDILDAIRKEIPTKDYAAHPDALALLQQIKQSFETLYGQDLTNPTPFRNNIGAILDPIVKMLNSKEDVEALAIPEPDISAANASNTAAANSAAAPNPSATASATASDLNTDGTPTSSADPKAAKGEDVADPNGGAGPAPDGGAAPKGSNSGSDKKPGSGEDSPPQPPLAMLYVSNSRRKPSKRYHGYFTRPDHEFSYMRQTPSSDSDDEQHERSRKEEEKRQAEYLRMLNEARAYLHMKHQEDKKKKAEEKRKKVEEARVELARRQAEAHRLEQKLAKEREEQRKVELAQQKERDRLAAIEQAKQPAVQYHYARF